MSAKPATNNEPISKQSLRVWLKLLKTSTTIEQMIRRRLRDEHGTTLPRFDVMSALSRFPDGLKMSEISDVLRVSNGNITGIVDRLLDDGLVSREHVANDRRALKILLTDEGHAVFSAQARCHEEWIAGILADAGPQKLNALSELLEDISQELDSAVQDNPPQ